MLQPMQYRVEPVGYSSALPLVINNNNQMLFNYSPELFVESPFVYDYEQGSYTDLAALLGRNDEVARDMNDHGDVVTRHYLYSEGTFTELTSDVGSVNALAINNSRQIVGHINTVAEQLPFLYSDGSVQVLGSWFGGGVNLPHGINSQGQIVGEATASNHHLRAFVYDQGAVTNLHPYFGDEPDLNSSAFAINDSGQIIGYFTPTNISERGFLLDAGVLTEIVPADGGVCTRWTSTIRA